MMPENDELLNVGKTPEEEAPGGEAPKEEILREGSPSEAAQKEQSPGEEPEEPAPELKQTPYGAVQRVVIAIKPGYVLRKVGQAFMVMPTGPRMKEYQGMITLNETGAFLFKEAQKENPTAQKFIDACIAEYGATPEEADKAVNAFLIQCVQCGLMEAETVYYDKRTGQKVTMEEMAEGLKSEEMAEGLEDEPTA